MVGLFVDTANLYYCVSKCFRKRKLDYQKLWNQVSGIGHIFKAFAYGIQVDSEAAGFITCLQKLGFETKYKQPEIIEDKVTRDTNWNVGLTIDIVRLSPRLNTVVISSADIELMPTLQWLKDQHMCVHIIACTVPDEIKEIADHWIEITEDLLEIRGRGGPN